MKKVIRLVGLFLLGLFVAVVSMPMPIHAQDVEETPVTCSLSVSAYDSSKPNHFEVTISLSGAEWGHLGWPLSGGTDAQDGDTKGVDLSYDAPNRWQQTITFSVNGQECAHADVTVEAWQPVPEGPENPPDDTGSVPVPGTPSVGIPSVPVIAGSKSWQCVSMSVSVDKVIKNRLNVVVTVQGQLPVYPVKLSFGDDSFTYPMRDGGRLTSFHDYDPAKLISGVTIKADLSPLGDFADSCLFTTFGNGGSQSFASNTGGSYVK